MDPNTKNIPPCDYQFDIKAYIDYYKESHTPLIIENCNNSKGKKGYFYVFLPNLQNNIKINENLTQFNINNSTISILQRKEYFNNPLIKIPSHKNISETDKIYFIWLYEWCFHFKPELNEEERKVMFTFLYNFLSLMSREQKRPDVF